MAYIYTQATHMTHSPNGQVDYSPLHKQLEGARDTLLTDPEASFRSAAAFIAADIGAGRPYDFNPEFTDLVLQAYNISGSAQSRLGEPGNAAILFGKALSILDIITYEKPNAHPTNYPQPILPRIKRADLQFGLAEAQRQSGHINEATAGLEEILRTVDQIGAEIPSFAWREKIVQSLAQRSLALCLGEDTCEQTRPASLERAVELLGASAMALVPLAGHSQYNSEMAFSSQAIAIMRRRQEPSKFTDRFVPTVVLGQTIPLPCLVEWPTLPPTN